MLSDEGYSYPFFSCDRKFWLSAMIIPANGKRKNSREEWLALEGSETESLHKAENYYIQQFPQKISTAWNLLFESAIREDIRIKHAPEFSSP